MNESRNVKKNDKNVIGDNHLNPMSNEYDPGRDLLHANADFHGHGDMKSSDQKSNLNSGMSADLKDQAKMDNRGQMKK
jgi:hypothetical protein